MTDPLSILDRYPCPACRHSRAVMPVGCPDPSQHAQTQGQARHLLDALRQHGAIPDPPTAEWLRALLERHGCSQMDAARLLRCDPRTFRRWASRAPRDDKRLAAMPWPYAVALVSLLDERNRASGQE